MKHDVEIQFIYHQNCSSCVVFVNCDCDNQNEIFENVFAFISRLFLFFFFVFFFIFFHHFFIIFSSFFHLFHIFDYFIAFFVIVSIYFSSHHCHLCCIWIFIVIMTKNASANSKIAKQKTISFKQFSMTISSKKFSQTIIVHENNVEKKNRQFSNNTTVSIFVTLRQKFFAFVNTLKKKYRKTIFVSENQQKKIAWFQKWLNRLFRWNCFLYFTNDFWQKIVKKCHENSFDVNFSEIQFTRLKIMNDVKFRKNKIINRMKIQCIKMFVTYFWFTITKTCDRMFRNDRKFHN